MRLGGYVFCEEQSAEAYALAHVKKGFRAAVCPWWLSMDAPEKIEEFKEVMKKHDIRIAEVGAWCNPLDPNPEVAEKNIQYMIERLRLAEALEADTCVNILGSKNKDCWDGPCREGYREEFFNESVAVMQRVIDAVNPVHTKLSFEMMPFYFLDGPEEYLHFLKAIDRPTATAVHLDICNTMNNPRRLYNNSEFIRHTFELLKDYIVTLHLKDIRLNPNSGVAQFEEVLIGEGDIDYLTLLAEIKKLPADIPAMLEHLETEEEYDRAAAAVRSFEAMI